MSIEERVSALEGKLAGVAAALGETGAKEPVIKAAPRGRPARGEVTDVAVKPTQTPVAPPAAEVVTEHDPFADAPAPTLTLDQVRVAAIALSKATSQENAVAVMKAAAAVSSFGELKPEQYASVLAAFNGAIPAPKVDNDPFGVSTPTEQSEQEAPSLQDVKDAVVAAQRRTGTDKVQAVIVANGGIETNPSTGIRSPSLKALSVSSYAKVIAAIKALPVTK